MKEDEDKSVLPKLSLDISVPAHVLSRRGAIASCSSSYSTSTTSENLCLKRRGAISFGRTSDLNYYVEFDKIDNRNILPFEHALIETLDRTPRKIGKFLTLNRRRKRVPLTLDEHVDEGDFVDTVYHGQTNLALRLADEWPFNAFTLDSVCGGRALPALLVHLFNQYGLIDYFELDAVKVWKCFSLIEEGYHGNNPYHNAVHASDVTQAMHCFLKEEKIARHITPLEIMSALIAAVGHDLDHPGVNQPFLVATCNHLATLYQNSSVLENHHWRSAVGCLLESSIFSHLSSSVWKDLCHQVRSLILATDITRQQEFLMRFKGYMDEDGLDLQYPENRHFILQIALKCADICNPCRPWNISKMWSDRVCEEFFRQGDYERQLNLPVTSLCDRFAMSKPKIQAGFFRFVVGPLFEAWHRFHQTPLSQNMIQNLRMNQDQWDLLVQEEIASSSTDSVSVSVECEEQEDRRSSGLRDIDLPSSPRSSDSSLLRGRRHSMPPIMAKLIPRPTLRRQSFPRHRALASMRTLSAEALIPDSRITSISREASRLVNLFSDSRGKYLMKQMTFPPTRTNQIHIHSQSWHEACAQLLPGVICPTVLAEMQAMEEGTESKSPSEQEFPKCDNGCGTPPDEKEEEQQQQQQQCCQPQIELLQSQQENKEVDEEEDKENADPRLHFQRRHSEEMTIDKLSSILRRSNSVGFTRTANGRRGSAPTSGLRGEEIAGGLRGGGEGRRRGSVPVEALAGFYSRRRHSADSSIIVGRRGSVPLCRRESFFSDIRMIPSSGSESTLHDDVSITFDSSLIGARFSLRRSSVPIELFGCSKKSTFLSQEVTADKNRKPTLFRPRRESVDWWRLDLSQSESFDLGLLPTTSHEESPSHVTFGRRSSLPASLLPTYLRDESTNPW